MAAGRTYDSISSTTLSSNTASVTFSSIPATYTDLILVANFGMASSNGDLWIQFNGDTTSNYSWVEGYANTSGVTVERATNQTYARWIYGNLSGNRHNTGIAHIGNYSSTGGFKYMVQRFDSLGRVLGFRVSSWRSTSAISTILVYGSNQDIATGSIISLYGIAAA